MSNKSSTTGLINGMPSLLRIASASRSGSPGMRGPLVPGAGLVFLKDLNPVVHLRFELDGVDKPVDPHGPEGVTDPFADTSNGNLLPERERWREGSPVGPAQDAGQDIYHGGEAVTFVTARFPFGAERQWAPPSIIS